MKKVSPYLQYSAVECGACSLGSILRYYGRNESLSKLRQLLGVNRDGSKASDILKGARLFGLEAKGMKIPVGAFKEDYFPCILFWEFNHFLVLEGFKKGRAYLSNPALGRYSVSIEDFKKSYTGVALVFEPGADFIKGGEPEISLYKRILGIPQAYPYASSLILITSIIAVIPQLFIAGASGQFVNAFLSEGKAYMGMPIVVVTALSIFISFASLIGLQTLIRRLQLIISKKISLNLFKRVFEASFGYLSQRSSTELSTRMTLGLQYSQSVISTFYSYASNLIQAFIVTLFMFLISWQLTVLTILIIGLNLCMVCFLVDYRSDDNKKLSIAYGVASSKGFLSLLNIETIKSSGLESITLDSWLDEYMPIVDQSQALGKSLIGIGVISRMSSLFLNLLTLTYGAYLILNGNFTLGGLLAFQFLSSVIQAPLNSITSLGQTLQSIDGLVGRLKDLDLSNTSNLAPNLSSGAANDFIYDINESSYFSGSVELHAEKLSFRFGENLPLFFNEISLTFAQGSRTTIVGTSGSGKSTLIKLIAGLIEPTSGRVLLNKNDFQKINPSVRSDFISYVPQEMFLFDSTIAENLSLWDPSIKNDVMIEATRNAEIYEKIKEFPNLFDTQLSTFSTKLSGGQQQRLCIARALSRRPKILLLDEATSALDENTERAVLNNIYSLGITTISIAHRLFTALSGDNVIVMDNGKIIEHGNPSELLDKKGIFAQLVKQEKDI